MSLYKELQRRDNCEVFNYVICCLFVYSRIHWQTSVILPCVVQEMFHVCYLLQMLCSSSSIRNCTTDTSTLKSAWVSAQYEHLAVSLLVTEEQNVWIPSQNFVVNIVFFIIRVDQLWTRGLSRTTTTATSSTTFSVSYQKVVYIFLSPAVISVKLQRMKEEFCENVCVCKQMLMALHHWSCQTSGSGTSLMSSSTRYSAFLYASLVKWQT